MTVLFAVRSMEPIMSEDTITPPSLLRKVSKKKKEKIQGMYREGHSFQNVMEVCAQHKFPNLRLES